jgi:hypothetical protein
MPGRVPSIRRTFAGGWLSDEDASIMALIWQFEPGPATDGRDHFEAEVIRGVEKIASLRGKSVAELRRTLDETYGHKLTISPAPSTSSAERQDSPER